MSSSTVQRQRVLLYSSNAATRESIRLAVGRRLASDLPPIEWLEHATGDAVIQTTENEDVDLLILDGEAQPVGGMGLCRQLKNEIFECPPIVILTARPQDDWLAAWSQADGAVPSPFDPLSLNETLLTAMARDAVTSSP